MLICIYINIYIEGHKMANILELIKINKHSPIPIYYQIEKAFRDNIVSGTLSEGEKLPTEMELVQKLGVSRPTIRQAMVNLAREGLIDIKRGSGTFVRTINFEEPVFGIRSYAEEALKKGYNPTTKILSLKTLIPDLELRKILNLKVEDRVIEIKRLRYLNEEPTALDTTYIPDKLVPGISKKDFEKTGKQQSLYNILKVRYGLSLSSGEETIDATIVTPNEAKLLLMKTKSPINLRRRLIYSDTGEILLYMKSIYKTRYKIKLEGPF